jgi:hypothetical protein
MQKNFYSLRPSKSESKVSVSPYVVHIKRHVSHLSLSLYQQSSSTGHLLVSGQRPRQHPPPLLQLIIIKHIEIRITLRTPRRTRPPRCRRVHVHPRCCRRMRIPSRQTLAWWRVAGIEEPTPRSVLVPTRIVSCRTPPVTRLVAVLGLTTMRTRVFDPSPLTEPGIYFAAEG